MGKRLNKFVPRHEKIKTTLVKTAGLLARVNKSPDEELSTLIHDVQHARLYTDGKRFVDLVPRGRMSDIEKEYMEVKQHPDFDLATFVAKHFYDFAPHLVSATTTNETMSVSQHIDILWKNLRRRNRRNRGSLIALPHDYVVPGGRFSEQYYWDSYFIMLGLAVSGQWQQIDNMMNNYTFMLRKFGFIPTANRTYFLSRSQPPFFAAMVKLQGHHTGRNKTYVSYLPYLLLEYRFWMRGRRKLEAREHKAYARIVELPDGSIVNRYYDNKTSPRPESLREDVMTAQTAPMRESERLFLHLRAAAESGWDFSSRWLLDPRDMSTIHTADIVPVDLNCLLYELEDLLSETYAILKNAVLARKFRAAAERRKHAIMQYCWNESEQFFDDYNFHHNQHTGRMTLAGVFPLYVGVATPEQASAVARRIEQDFLQSGGLLTSLIESGQQWDAPNGWAPLHWIVIVGLRKYGFTALADVIKERWIATNMRVFTSEHRLVEKYDVTKDSGLGGGGEYTLQDGFGWTNGVLAVLLRE